MNYINIILFISSKYILHDYSGAKIYNALPTHLKIERFYLPFKQGLIEHFMD